jgi:phenol hydroxylase P0 protein
MSESIDKLTRTVHPGQSLDSSGLIFSCSRPAGLHQIIMLLRSNHAAPAGAIRRNAADAGRDRPIPRGKPSIYRHFWATGTHRAKQAAQRRPHENAMPIPATDPPACDLSQRFVRVLGRRDNGFVEFAFSLGWPELSVDLLLPEPDFEAFCRTHRVQQLDD